MNFPTTPGTLGRVRASTAAVVRRVVVTGALALTVLGLGVPAASAEEDERIGVEGGYAHFTNDQADIGQETLWVGDDKRAASACAPTLTGVTIPVATRSS